jgi:hypothetical protein
LLKINTGYNFIYEHRPQLIPTENDTYMNVKIDGQYIFKEIKESLSLKIFRNIYKHIAKPKHENDTTQLSNEDIDYLYRAVLEQYANQNLLKLDEDWLNVGKSKQEENKQQVPTLSQLSSKNYHALVIAAQDYEY